MMWPTSLDLIESVLCTNSTLSKVKSFSIWELGYIGYSLSAKNNIEKHNFIYPPKARYLQRRRLSNHKPLPYGVARIHFSTTVKVTETTATNELNSN